MFAGCGLVVMPGRSGLSIPSLPCGADPGAANFFESQRQRGNRSINLCIQFSPFCVQGLEAVVLAVASWFLAAHGDSQRLIDSDRCLFIARCPGCVLVYNDRNYQPGKYI
uniref:Uncharacterized protein n=1 Tax=Oryza punctata TaxID=4537 RepID=A0A0E0K232_ORYPU